MSFGASLGFFQNSLLVMIAFFFKDSGSPDVDRDTGTTQQCVVCV